MSFVNTGPDTVAPGLTRPRYYEFAGLSDNEVFRLDNEVVDPKRTLLSSRLVIEAGNSNDFYGMITEGPPGSGKTRLLMKKLATVYGEWQTGRDKDDDKITYMPLECMDWDAWKTWMPHDLGEFLAMVRHVQNKGRQALMGGLDDAGRVASNQKWQTDFGRNINEYANVQRRDFGGLDFTTYSRAWLLGHIRNMPGGHYARVARISGNKSQRQLRRARVYEGWESPDLKKRGVKLQYEEHFDIWLPPRVEREWEPVNRKYAQLAIEDAEATYHRMMEKGRDKKAEGFRREFEEKTGKSLETDDPKR